MKIYRNTVSDTLWETLMKLMKIDELEKFRLVGGTSLSLLIGHRVSVDIDLFTDAEYGTIDFNKIIDAINSVFNFVETSQWSNNTLGNTCYIGATKKKLIKVDLFYTDPFVFPILNYKHLRLSQIEEIAAMKLEIVGNGGRKKDFWDIHELTQYFTIEQMIHFYLKRYPYGHSKNEIISQLTNFEHADYDFDPICLQGKYWELIKLDLIEILTNKGK